MRFARCAHCWLWLPENKLVILGCPACFYQTARCHKCDGAEGAVKSIFCHFNYWQGRGHEDGGHSSRLTEWATYATALARIRALEGEDQDASTKTTTPRKQRQVIRRKAAPRAHDHEQRAAGRQGSPRGGRAADAQAARPWWARR